ncbi:hypothetical protein FGO68_gene8285 [Halteria grandinella]|uniref:Histone H2A n=1 Tax=Halteria grandinella TaxID=5974 RepID=A0A8J8NJM1_HALGN|nr:hypothetical protein FGO68_gene8285 [Halteria grandinella]
MTKTPTKTPVKQSESQPSQASPAALPAKKGKGRPSKNTSSAPPKPAPLPVSLPQGGYQGSSSTAKANLQFSVPRVAKFMKEGRYSQRIGGGAPVFLASSLQYIMVEICELAGNQAQLAKKHRITPRHIMLGIRSDPELNKLIGKNADFTECGVVINVHKDIRGGKKGKGKGKDIDEDIDMAENE